METSACLGGQPAWSWKPPEAKRSCHPERRIFHRGGGISVSTAPERQRKVLALSRNAHCRLQISDLRFSICSLKSDF
jgi:hypothetical protein